MGYTYYWRRPCTIPDALFQAVRSDFEKLILPLSDAGIELAGGFGEGLPEITKGLIRMNRNRVKIAWKFDRKTARRKFGYKRKSLKLENRERAVRGLGFGRVLRDRERG